MVDILISYGCIFFFLGGVPPSRWIVNYDFDLLDGLVIGAVLGAHMPFLVGEILLIPIDLDLKELSIPQRFLNIAFIILSVLKF